jgi:protein TonB
MNGFPWGVLFALIATTSLFLTLPLLTQLQPLSGVKPVSNSIFIDAEGPEPPPPETRDDDLEQTPPERRIVEQTEKTRPVQPKIDLVRGPGLVANNGGIEIAVPKVQTGIPHISRPVLTPGEVDHAPKVLRSFPPQYPYIAKRDNVEGWVVLRFVVDANGAAGKMTVVSAEPEGVFDEAAMKAVARYKFKPAVKDGEVVDCLVSQRILFSLD